MGSIITYLPKEPRSLNLMRPVILAKRGSSLPRPTLRPGFTRVPRWRTMMVPPGTTCPPNALKPSRWELESRPFRELPNPFLCAINRFSVLGSQFSVLSSRFSVLGSGFSVLGRVLRARAHCYFVFFAEAFFPAVFFAAFFLAVALGAAVLVSPAASAFLGLVSFFGSSGALKDWPL